MQASGVALFVIMCCN